MTQGKTIAKNAAWLIFGTTAQKVISFLTFTFVARFMGVSITGEYFSAVTVTSLFVGFADLGLTPVVIRETAADVVRGSAILARALRIKMVLVPFSILGALGYVYLLHSKSEVILAVALACFVMTADTFSLLWYGAIRGRQQLKYEAWGMFLGQLITACVTMIAALAGWGVYGLIFGLLAGSVWNLGWSVSRSFALGINLHADSTWTIAKIARLALPFALAGIFVRVYSSVDTLLLRQSLGALAVGFYAVAYKVTYAFQFFPLAFVAALYPSMSAAHAAGDHVGLRKVLTGSMRLMMLAGVPLAAGISALAPQFVPVVYGKAYLGSILPLTVLPWVLIPIFLDFPIGSLLNATGRAGKKTMAMGITMVVNVAANFLLVPMFGPVGAALAGVISFYLLFLVGVWYIRNDIDRAWMAWLCVRGFVAAGLLWTALHMLVAYVPFFINLVLAVILMPLILFLVGLLRQEDLRLIRDWFKRRSVALPIAEEIPHE